MTWQPGRDYHCPLNATSAEAIDSTWEALLGGHAEEPLLLHLHYGRDLLVCIPTALRTPSLRCLCMESYSTSLSAKAHVHQ